MHIYFRRAACLLLSVMLFIPTVLTVGAYEKGDAYHKDLSTWIQNEDRREYVEMMLDYYIRTDSMVRDALDGGFAAVFLFDGCSDNMDDRELSDLSYYRVSGICIVIKKDETGQLRMLYFNDRCSTIPDHPLKYGAWQLPKVGSVGPATVCDGTYQLYSVYHKGRYEALNARTEYYDAKLDAVYMVPEGYVVSRATEINVHTRTSNHVLSSGMWSAGCPLVGGGESWEFWKLMYAVYYTSFDEFELDTFVGSLTVDRQALRHEMYTLYEDPDAVDRILEHSRSVQPEGYLEKCAEVESYALEKVMAAGRETELMTLPCSNETDARSRQVTSIAKWEKVTLLRCLTNTQGNRWYQVQFGEENGYVYAGDLVNRGWLARLMDWLKG